MARASLLLSARGAAVILLLLLLLILEPNSSNCRNIDLFQQLDSSPLAGRNLKRVVNYNWVKRSEDVIPAAPEASGPPEAAEQAKQQNEPGETGGELEGGAEEEAAPVGEEVAQVAPDGSGQPEAGGPELQSGPVNTSGEDSAEGEDVEAGEGESSPSQPAEAEKPAENTDQKTAEQASQPAPEAKPVVSAEGPGVSEQPATGKTQPETEAPADKDKKTPEQAPQPEPQVEVKTAANAEQPATSRTGPEEEKAAQTAANPPEVTPTAAVKEEKTPVESKTPAEPAQRIPEAALVGVAANLAGPPANVSEQETYDPLAGEERWSYKVDRDTCEPLETKVPSAILRMTIERIFESLNGVNCSSGRLGLKLTPMTGKQMVGHVMEVGSMPIEAARLIRARDTLVKCTPLPTEEGSDLEKLRKFELVFLQQFDDQRLKSKWRHHPRLQLDDIPLSSSFNLISPNDKKSSGQQQQQPEKLAGSGSTRPSKRCQRFKLESGEFYLELLGLETEVRFSVQLKPYNATNFAASDKHGGQIRMKHFKLKRLFLNHSLIMSSSLKREFQERIGVSSGPESGSIITTDNDNQPSAHPTVQVLHEHNNHFRRNNWLLSVYGSWLKQEYRKQLAQVLSSRGLLEHMNTCLREK